MADRLDYYFRQKVTEAELDLGFDLLEQADRSFANDIGIFGIIDGMVASEKAGVPDLTVDLAAPGRAYDQLGQRIFFGTLQNVDLSTDLNGVSTAVQTAGNEKIVSLFIKFDRVLSDPRTDGNSQQVFFRRDESFQFVVRQGAEAPAGSALPPPLQPDEVLIVDVTRAFGQTQILNADLSPNPTIPGDVGRQQQFIFAEASAISAFSGGFNTLSPVTDDVQATLQEIDDELTDHFGATARRHDAPDVDAGATAGSPNALGAGTVRSQLDALLGHINDHENQATGAHTASAIAYAGGGPWADATTNPATSVEAQLDKVVADLAGATGAPKVGAAATAGSPNALAAGTVKSQLDELLGHINAHEGQATGAHAASAVSYAGSGNWADTTAVAAASVEAALDEIVSDLAVTSGAPKVGAAATAGSPNALTAGTVKSQLNELLDHINSHESQATGAHVASAVSYAGSGTWADASSVTGGSVEAAIDEVVSDLGAATGAPKVGAAATPGSPNALAAGSVKSQLDALLGHINAHENQAAGGHSASAVAYAGGGAWADGTLNPGASVEAQLDKIIADLAAIAGALKVGAAATAGTPNALAAGTVKSQLDALLGFTNANAANANKASRVMTLPLYLASNDDPRLETINSTTAFRILSRVETFIQWDKINTDNLLGATVVYTFAASSPTASYAFRCYGDAFTNVKNFSSITESWGETTLVTRSTSQNVVEQAINIAQLPTVGRFTGLMMRCTEAAPVGAQIFSVIMYFYYG